jgi:hypothetical protein
MCVAVIALSNLLLFPPPSSHENRPMISQTRSYPSTSLQPYILQPPSSRPLQPDHLSPILSLNPLLLFPPLACRPFLLSATSSTRPTSAGTTLSTLSLSSTKTSPSPLLRDVSLPRSTLLPPPLPPPVPPPSRLKTLPHSTTKTWKTRILQALSSTSMRSLMSWLVA